MTDSEESHAPQACVICKSRKTKCDKLLPSCGYCIRKKITCVYADKRNSISSALSFVSQSIPPESASIEASLYGQVLQLIHQTGQLVYDIGARYFQGPHRYLPVCSRSNFYSNVITLGAIPSAGFSVLLLTACLTVSAHADQQSLRRATNSLVTFVQESYPISLPLIQARLLLAVYDYTHGRPEDAFQAIAGCARMAYAARIHLHCLPAYQKDDATPTANTKAHSDMDRLLQATEAANTWWGIIICERAFFCEVAVPEQPLVSTISNGDMLLPTKPETLWPGDFQHRAVMSIHGAHIPVSCIGSFDIAGFGRAAQAAWLLDKVFKAFEIPSLNSRLAQLEDLDITIQTFLGVLLQQCNVDEKSTDFCQAIAMSIRALFVIHKRQTAQVLDSEHRSTEKWQKRSHTVLDTATTMVRDIVEAHGSSDLVPPSYSYIIRSALEHIYARSDWKDDSTLRSVEDRLRISLHQSSQFPMAI